METILAIIPARGGSKRLPKKNIISFCGKPLVAHSIQAALKSKCITRTIVSTEDIEIADVSRSYGAEILQRPACLARDASPTNDVLLHVLEHLKKTEQYTPDILVLLQPTSPLRTTSDIDSAIQKFKRSKAESLISVTEYDHSPYWAFTIQKNMLTSVFGASKLKRSQELPPLYRPNGALYITTTATFLRTKTYYTKKITPFIMPQNKSVDIDDELGLLYAELLYKKQSKQPKEKK